MEAMPPPEKARESWSESLRLYLCSLGTRLGLDEHESRDAAQETWIRWTRRGERTWPRSWFIKEFRGIARDMRKKRSRETLVDPDTVLRIEDERTRKKTSCHQSNDLIEFAKHLLETDLVDPVVKAAIKFKEVEPKVTWKVIAEALGETEGNLAVKRNRFHNDVRDRWQRRQKSE